MGKRQKSFRCLKSKLSFGIIVPNWNLKVEPYWNCKDNSQRIEI
jgi:hypothetical protein